jgi:hypothetical protein
MAVSNGKSRSNCSLIEVRYTGMNGSLFGCLDDSGADAIAPSRTALSLFGGINQDLPCSKCHTLSPAA